MALPRALALLLALLVAAPADAGLVFGRSAVRDAVHAASVVLEPSGCTGVVAESADFVFTAHHCVDERLDFEVRFTTGARRQASVVATDPVADQALLLLDEPSDVEPLVLASGRQIPGTVLYFEGNPSRPKFQRARLDRVGRCPSLPDLPNALFTSIEGEPGDSGAPIVDAAARVVGLVHGGQQCHIATPSQGLVRLIYRVFDIDLPRAVRAEPAGDIGPVPCSGGVD